MDSCDKQGIYYENSFTDFHFLMKSRNPFYLGIH